MARPPKKKNAPETEDPEEEENRDEPRPSPEKSTTPSAERPPASRSGGARPPSPSDDDGSDNSDSDDDSGAGRPRPAARPRGEIPFDWSRLPRRERPKVDSPFCEFPDDLEDCPIPVSAVPPGAGSKRPAPDSEHDQRNPLDETADDGMGLSVDENGQTVTGSKTGA